MCVCLCLYDCTLRYHTMIFSSFRSLAGFSWIIPEFSLKPTHSSLYADSTVCLLFFIISISSFTSFNKLIQLIWLTFTQIPWNVKTTAHSKKSQVAARRKTFFYRQYLYSEKFVFPIYFRTSFSFLSCVFYYL